MKGLLYKDCVTLIKQLKFFLLLIALFALIPGGMLHSFAMIYALMLPFSAIAYDEQAKWDRMAAMMPYTRTQLVLSKYLLGWAGVLGATLLSLCGQFMGRLLRAGAPAEAGAAMDAALLTAPIALILLSIALPLLFRFGAERGRMAFVVLIVAFTIAATLAGKAFSAAPGEADVRNLIPWAAALAVLCNALSVPVSRRLYRQGARRAM